jgi:hypothetical protein
VGAAGHHWVPPEDPLEGYRRVLGQAGLLSIAREAVVEQPLAAHQHWHIDVLYINICGTVYYLCSILDGCGRYIGNRICGSR